MSWTYKSELDQLEVDLQRDSSYENRWTFHRKMYFEPSQYENWKSNYPISGSSYLVELLTDTHLPVKGSYLSGALSGFYMKEIFSIESMTSDENIDQYSYAIVDILYENMPQPASDTKIFGDKKPWQLPVQDFLVTNIEQTVPAEVITNDELEIRKFPTNSANQALYDLTMPRFKRKITWTVATRGVNFSFRIPIVNLNSFTFWEHTGSYSGGKITVPAGNALLFPPGLKRVFYQDKDGSLIPYDEWSYEMLIDERGHDLKYRDAGTRQQIDDKTYDICGWNITGLSGTNLTPYFEQKYGKFDDMMIDKSAVDTYNKNITNPTYRWDFHGEFINSPIPLSGGLIDYDALNGITYAQELTGQIFYRGTFSLGTSSTNTIAFREQVD